MTMRRAAAALAAVCIPVACRAHGHMTYPPSRHGGSLQRAGACEGVDYSKVVGVAGAGAGACLWFSQPAEIPGEPTVNDARWRTYNINVSSGPRDWSRKMPWRAPGTAPVIGSGCGSAGGGPTRMTNGGTPPAGIPQGFDGARLPAGNHTVWRRGAVEEVAYAIQSNHGGGYSWRLCKADGAAGVSEACFQRTVLRFATDKQWIQYVDYDNVYGEPMAHLPRFEMPLVRVTQGTHPEGSEWARHSQPGCLLCNQADCKGSWEEHEHCAQHCSGLSMPGLPCPPGMTQFPEPLPGISGFLPNNGHKGFPYNIVDKVVVPNNIPPGNYLLSWRWDCEQSTQIWQNCADIIVQ